MSRKKDPQRAYKRLHSFRHVYLILIVVVVLLASFLASGLFYFQNEYEKARETLSFELEAAENLLAFNDTSSTVERNYDREDFRSYLKIEALFLNEGKETVDSVLEEMNTDRSNEIYYFLDSDNNWHMISGDTAPQLKDQELMRLKGLGDIMIGQDELLSVPAMEGYLVVWIGYDYDIESVEESLAEIGNYVILVDTASGEVIYSTDPEMISDSTLPELRADESIDSEWEMGIMYPNTGRRLYDSLHKAVYATAEFEDEGYKLVVYEPVRMIVINSIADSAIPFAVMTIFVVVAIRSAIKLRDYMRPDARSKLKKLWGNVYVHVPSMKLLAALLGIAVLIEVAVTGYALVMYRYSYFGDEAREILSDCNRSLVDTNNELQMLSDDTENAALLWAQEIAEAIQNFPELLEDSKLSELSALFPSVEIDVFDSNGTITHSTGDYIGYTASTYQNDPEYECWYLLQGEENNLIYRADDESNKVFAAVRRTDAIGFVRVGLSSVRLNNLMELLSPTNAIASQYYTGKMYYIDLSDTDTMYRVDSKTGKSYALPNIFPIEELIDEFSGVRIISGSYSCYMMDVCEERNIALVNARPVLEIVEGEIEMIIYCVICYVLFTQAIIIGFALYAGEDFSESEEFRNIRHRQLIKYILKKDENDETVAERSRLLLDTLKHIIIWSALGLLLLFALNHLASKWSILSTLFIGGWEKGWNIFAVTMVLLLIVFGVFLCALIRWVAQQLIQYVDSHSATAIKLVSSLLQVVAAAWVFFMGLYYFGVDLSTIVAGIGITTLALSIGAKDSINDLIAGIFIVLDGHIRVGDMVTVGDFYGTVVDMNIRTTKVRYFNKIISINNSNMVNVINNSKEMSNAYITFAVVYGTDIDLVEKMIVNETDRINAYVDYRLTGKPVFCDVDTLGDFAVVCAVSFPVREKDRKSVTRKINRLLLTLCDEYGIELALPTYVLKDGDAPELSKGPVQESEP